MKLSDTPTNYLIVNTKTNSEWDECDFAIIPLDGNWKGKMQKRLQAITPFAKEYDLHSMNYYDDVVTFFIDDNEIMPDSIAFRNEKQWSFLITDEKEIAELSLTDNCLDCFRLVMLNGGSALYRCSGKNTGEEFWTAEFPVSEILHMMSTESCKIR